MKDQKHSQLKVGSPTHYNNQKHPEKSPEQINVHTAAEGVLAYVHPALHEHLKEERDRLKKEIEYCRSTLKDISIGACDCPDTIEECHSLLAHIQLDASWALCETDKEERQ